jgi:hypothetical protein
MWQVRPSGSPFIIALETAGCFECFSGDNMESNSEIHLVEGLRKLREQYIQIALEYRSSALCHRCVLNRYLFHTINTINTGSFPGPFLNIKLTWFTIINCVPKSQRRQSNSFWKEILNNIQVSKYSFFRMLMALMGLGLLKLRFS